MSEEIKERDFTKDPATLEELHDAILRSKDVIWLVRPGKDVSNPPLSLKPNDPSKENKEWLPTYNDPSEETFKYDGQLPIANYDGDEDPELLKKFHESYRKVLEALDELDNAFHDLWDCR